MVTAGDVRGSRCCHATELATVYKRPLQALGEAAPEDVSEYALGDGDTWRRSREPLLPRYRASHGIKAAPLQAMGEATPEDVSKSALGGGHSWRRSREPLLPRYRASHGIRAAPLQAMGEAAPADVPKSALDEATPWRRSKYAVDDGNRKIRQVSSHNLIGLAPATIYEVAANSPTPTDLDSRFAIVFRFADGCCTYCLCTNPASRLDRCAVHFGRSRVLGCGVFYL